MSKITKIVASKGLTGFYFDDQMAIKRGAKQDGFIYKGKPESVDLGNKTAGRSICHDIER